MQVLGLDDLDPELAGEHRDGRRRELLAAALLGVGPGDDELRAVRGVRERGASTVAAKSVVPR